MGGSNQSKIKTIDNDLAVIEKIPEKRRSLLGNNFVEGFSMKRIPRAYLQHEQVSGIIQMKRSSHILSTDSFGFNASLIEEGKSIVHMIILDAIFQKLLLLFLNSEYAADNLQFYIALENLRLVESTDPGSTDFKANGDNYFHQFQNIMKTFIITGAELEINISQNLRKKVLRLRSKVFSPSSIIFNRKEIEATLGEAQTEVLNILRGCLERFRSCSMYKNYLQNGYTSENIKPVASVERNSVKHNIQVLNDSFLNNNYNESICDNGDAHVIHFLTLKTSKFSSPKNILLVEKNELIGNLLGRRLMDVLHCNTFVINSSEGVLNKLYSTQFDVIIIGLEFEMDTTGMNIIEEYLENPKLHLNRSILDYWKKPIIIGTMKKHDVNIEAECMNVGFSVTLVKPFLVNDIAEILYQLKQSSRFTFFKKQTDKKVT